MWIVCYVSIFFFFFKQKTAYEMRISDWSSDVCSSDLDAFRDHDGEAATALDRTDDELDAIHRRFVDEATEQLSGEDVSSAALVEIGRASCRERVCQYV